MKSRNLLPILSILVLGATACGEEPEPFAAYPFEIYTGADPAGGGATYTVPVWSNVASATFALEGTCCTLTTGTGGEATITANTPGLSELVVTAGAEEQRIQIHVAEYTAAQYATGKASYEQNTCARSGCHEATSGPDNTPSAAAEHNDDALLLNIRAGNDPDGDIVRDFHRFTVPNDVVAYVRALAPKGNPGPDN